MIHTIYDRVTIQMTSKSKHLPCLLISQNENVVHPFQSFICTKGGGNVAKSDTKKLTCNISVLIFLFTSLSLLQH